MKEREALKLALEALKTFHYAMIDAGVLDRQEMLNQGFTAATVIKEILAQPELCKYGQEPKSCTSSPMDCQCAIDATFAQPEQEPVAWTDGPHLVMRTDWRDRANYKGPWVDIGRAIPDSWVPVLYTTPPQRTWVGLTDDEVIQIRDDMTLDIRSHVDFYRHCESKLKEKNT